ncbi:MAG: TIGR01777 family oxidoreductase [Planctomycetes bacterium]|jgi:hypothetical protein|nr:TIGR01777 family oxidoreductase [Planctomycetota bacterium]
MANRVVISGATGFIGRALCRAIHDDYEIVALSRDVTKAASIIGEYARVVEWGSAVAGGWARQIEDAHAVVNLAGENIAAGRWTQSTRNRIAQSRTSSAGALVEAISGARSKPSVFVQASAVGYYGYRGDEVLDEDSGVGNGFLADVCHKTESIATRVEPLGVRHVLLRSGVVLGREGGALPKFMAPYRFCLGGRLGSGRQWLSWINLEDEIRAIRFAMETPGFRGACNLTSPNPVTMEEFCRTLGQVLGKPAWTVVPAFALRLVLGQMADEALLTSQKALPKRLTEAGFTFKYPELRTALEVIIQGE